MHRTSSFQEVVKSLSFAVAGALVVFALARLIWHAPTPLLATSGTIFSITFLIVAPVIARRFWGPAKATATYLSLSLALTVLLLHSLYHWDRGGWIWHKLSGINSTWSETDPDAVNTPLREFVSRSAIFELADEQEGVLMISSGSYEVRETIIVPPTAVLKIEAGVVLRFAAGRSLIAHCPVIARGTAQAPIVFTALDPWRNWGTFGVVSPQPSVFEHVIVENGRHAMVNGVDFCGALSFIGAHVSITNCDFHDLSGRDGVYVKNGRVRIQNNRFRNCAKDGLDLDGGSGVITQNLFINCLDEGIDLSENGDLEVYDNLIRDARGGRLAADQEVDKIRSRNTLEFIQ